MKKFQLSFKDKMVSSVAAVGGTKFVQLSMEEGQVLAKHKTPNTLNLIVLSGRIQFKEDSEELLLSPSEMITVEPSVEHEVLALDRSTVLLVLVPKESVKEERVVIDQESHPSKVEHENAFSHPELLEKIVPEIRPFVDDHIKLCKMLESVTGTFEKHDVLKMLRAVGEELKHHFVAEEDLLFPLIGKHMGGDDVGPIPRLLEEHDIIRRLHREAEEFYDIMEHQPDAHVTVLLGEKVRDLATTLLNHLGKEDSHLFPMAGRLLTNEEKAIIAGGFSNYN